MSSYIEINRSLCLLKNVNVLACKTKRSKVWKIRFEHLYLGWITTVNPIIYPKKTKTLLFLLYSFLLFCHTHGNLSCLCTSVSLSIFYYQQNLQIMLHKKEKPPNYDSSKFSNWLDSKF